MRVSLGVWLALSLLVAGCSGDDGWLSRPEPADTPAPVAFADLEATTTTAGGPELAEGMDRELAHLTDARRTWERHNSTVHRYAIEFACVCLSARPATLVSVRDDVVTAAVAFGPEFLDVDATGAITDGDGSMVEGPTPAWLFDQIESALLAGQSVEVDYDRTTGLPVRAVLDTAAEVTPEIRLWGFTDISAGQAELIEAQTLWDESGITTYSWTYGVIAITGATEVTVSVAGGTGTGGLSVEQVHALIAEAHVKPDQIVTASYDAELGLPVQVTIEQPLNVDNLPFRFTGVTALEPA